MKRRERTRRLIELGGLIVKARLDVLVEDDRAAIYGALLGLVQQVDGEQRNEIIALWRRKGKRAFEAEAKTHLDDWSAALVSDS
ncbi:conjugal transfer protein TraD [Sphingosinicella sp.]|uniref:conjugal transfer protein TraD n=1 Tax=Sphingosinicella sp. TaxID=1917971 RepID=UPI0035B1E6CC